MGLEAKTNNYWIAPNAISISLNALGNANRIQGSVVSGSVISCYIQSVKPESTGEEYAGNGDGLGLDNGRNPKRWPLTISRTFFNSDTPKYVYVAIPRKASFGTQAVVVFPSEKIDIYGRNSNDEQLGSMDYFYVWLQGIISAPTGEQLAREWTQQIVWGSLGTYEDIMNVSETDWYSYSGSTQAVTFLKKIIMQAGSFFENIFLGDHELTGVATAGTPDEYIDSDTLVATPNFIKQHYLRRDADDYATGLIGFVKGLWVKAAGLFGFSEEGDVVARTLTALGSGGNTVTDADNSTQKNLGLEVVESGIIGGIMRVGKAILTKTIQSMNFTGGDSMFGTGWQLTDNDGNNNSRLVVDNLFVRMKAVFNELEVRRFVAMGGNYVFSPAASVIEEVDYIGHDGNGNEVVLGYEYVRVPWVMRLVPVALFGKILSRKKMIRSSSEDINWAEVDTFRCWLRSDDGTTRTINTWDVGMLARCQTFNVAPEVNSDGTGTWNNETGVSARHVSNKLYWRAVIGVGTSRNNDNYSLPNHILEDGLSHNYIDLANHTKNGVQLYLTGSDRPEAYDNIVCYGDWKNKSLSNVISIETVGSEAPVIRELLGVGYTDGSSIDWSLNNKERTRISPVSGNRFVAPSFVITTDPDEMDGDELYNEKKAVPAFRYDNTPGQSTVLAPDGSIVLLVYSDIENNNALKIAHVTPAVIDPVTGRPSGGITWETQKANLGDAYVSQQDGHRYVATPTGWDDKGLVNESKSTLKVDINGITARVSDTEGNISQLQQTAAGLVSMVSRESLSRNILSGVLTGMGWKSGVWNSGTFTPSGDITIDEAGWFTKNAQADNCFALEGVTLAEGNYMLSVCSAAVSETGTPSTDYPSIACYLKKTSDTFTIATTSGAERRGCTSSIEVAESQIGTYTLYIVSPKIRYPQLEAGTTITDFDAPVLEESLSLILQTADNISLSIINKLGEVGIDIDGNNRNIELRGDKVTFQNTAGTLQSPKIWIDPTTGTLHAEDGDFRGVVTAKCFHSNYINLSDKYVVDLDSSYKPLNKKIEGHVDFVVGTKKVYTRSGSPGAYVYEEIDIEGYGNFITTEVDILLPNYDTDLISQHFVFYNEKIANIEANSDTSIYICDSGGFTGGDYLYGVGKEITWGNVPIQSDHDIPSTSQPIPIWSFAPVTGISYINGIVEVMCVPNPEENDFCRWTVLNIGTQCYLLN